MFENITYEKILERMLARVSDRFDKREGSVIWDTHSPTAIEFQILYLELDAILREAYGDTASREFLILRCKERGISPYGATKAVLKGEFSPVNIEMTGERFNIGMMNYTVTEKIGEGEYQVQCETAGTEGNQYLGRMTPIAYIDGLESAELTKVLIPGENEEETEALRQRYLASFEEKSFGGNVADYLEKTEAIPGVGKAKVTRIWNGDIRPTQMIPSEEVKEWYESTVDTLPEEIAKWLTSVYTAAAEKKLTTGGTVLLTILDSAYGAASDTLIKTVQNKIDPTENAGDGYGLAPIGHVVSVRSAAEIRIYVKTKITFDTGYGWNNLQTAIDEAVSDYLLTLRKSWAASPCLIVRISQIETRILDIPGIIDIQDTSVNGKEDNLILGTYEIPVYGGAGE